MAISKRSITEIIEDADNYDGDVTDVFIEELLFNLKVIRDAKKIIQGKSSNVIGSSKEEDGTVTEVREPSGYFILTNNGKTLQVNPAYSKLY